MSLQDVQRVTEFGRLAQARDAGVSIMGGEPTLHPQLVEIVDHIRQISPSAGIQLLSNLLCDEALLHELAPRRVGCLVNVGSYADFSTHWCFAFDDVPELRIPNIFEYRDLAEVHRTLCARVGRLERDLDTQCDSTGCRSLECVGPCIALKYYRKVSI